MKLSQKAAISYIKATDRKFNVYSFDLQTRIRKSAYMCLDALSAFQEMVNRSAEGFLVIVLDEEGEGNASKWEMKNHRFIDYDTCKQWAVKTYLMSQTISRV